MYLSLYSIVGIPYTVYSYELVGIYVGNIFYKI